MEMLLLKSQGFSVPILSALFAVIPCHCGTEKLTGGSGSMERSRIALARACLVMINPFLRMKRHERGKNARVDIDFRAPRSGDRYFPPHFSTTQALR